MKTIPKTHLVIFLFFFSACGGSSEQSSEISENEGAESVESSENNQEPSSEGESLRRYALKSAVIEYTVSGLQSGSETVYFDDWGMKEAKYSNTELKMAGVSQKTNQITYIDGEWNYTYDVTQNAGTKIKNPFFAVLQQNIQEKDLKTLGEKMMKGMGGEIIGQEEVLGKACDVWEVKSLKTKTWVWKNISLKTESNLMGNLTIEATSIDENANIPAEKLALPEGVEFQDLSEMMQNVPGLPQSN